VTTPRTWVFLALLTGCAEGNRLEDVQVVEAVITEVSVFRMAVLEVVTAEGDELAVPIRLAGPRLGFIVDLVGGWGVVDLPIMGMEAAGKEGIPGTDLLGTYEGMEYSVEALVGFHYALLTNEADLTMPLTTLDVGAGGSTNYVWLDVVEAPEE
jgi:hypothetical protein